jgi:hypothetical protein
VSSPSSPAALSTREAVVELVDEIAQYEDAYRMCFLRAPEGFIVGLAQPLS